MIQASPVAAVAIAVVLCLVISTRQDLITAVGLGVGIALYQLFGFYALLAATSWSVHKRQPVRWRFLVERQEQSGYRDIAWMSAALVLNICIVVLDALLLGSVGVVAGALVPGYVFLVSVDVVVAVALGEKMPLIGVPLLPLVVARAAAVRMPQAVTWARDHLVDLLVWAAVGILSAFLVASGVVVFLVSALMVTVVLTGGGGPIGHYIVLPLVLVFLAIQVPGVVCSFRRQRQLSHLLNSTAPFTTSELSRAIESMNTASSLTDLVEALRRNPSRYAADVLDALGNVAARVERLRLDHQSRRRYLVDVLPGLRPLSPVYGRWQPVMRFLITTPNKVVG